MSTPDNPDPADFAGDEDDAAIDEALAALTSGMPLTATAEEDEELGEDTIGEAEEDFDEDEDDDGADDAADDLIGALEVPQASDAPINFAEPGEELVDMVEEPMEELRGPITFAAAPEEDRRLAQLEQLANALIDAENIREGQKVKRKVKASATGAAGAGLVPVVLMLTGAFDLEPELAATLAAGVAALASFLTGYLTPERQPALDPVVAHKVKTPRKSHK
ncbi:MAG TPA: hypothetical protein VFX51_04810 [Solirubrobacteraceae bacterium]|nr:hypothetical protein [Solirubrobacteraceae bacterium]